ncbi:RNaseH domain-containing protein [Micromonospora sp. NPDC048170]|uniref:RNaseH domain-containing protein n=1 Tax=Micromonospora sp. NPDC048170 TaxID=3154819 RepID=UPI0033E58696
MTDTETSENTAKPPRRTTGDHLRLLAFDIEPGTRWDVECDVAAMPATWFTELDKQWRTRPFGRPGHSLPTSSLKELLCGIDPAIMYINWDLRSDDFIVAFPGIDTYVVTDAIASWATTEITDQVDWYQMLKPADLVFDRRCFNLLEYAVRANGTAAVAPHVYQMLPSFLAKEVVDKKLDLLGKARRDFILGPPRSDGRRSAVLWPPQRTDDDRAGPGLVTAKIDFHLETAPNFPVPRIHADVSISRFPLMPVAYVPSRGKGPTSATIWLHGPQGFLGRDDEPHTLLSALARQMRIPGGGWQWQWSPGLARALAKLTQLSFPDPHKTLADPAAAADVLAERAIRAYFLYSEGTKSQAADADAASSVDADGNETRRAKTLAHAANTGLVPGDHVDVHDRLRSLLTRRGIRPLPDLERVGSRATRKIKAAFDPNTTYTIELWTQSDITREAVLATLEHHFGLARESDPADNIVVRFTGDLNITVRLRNGAEVGVGVQPDPDKKKTNDAMLQLHTNRLARDVLGRSTDRLGAIVELQDAAFYQRARLIDPKPGLKRAFARTNRRLQCLRPAQLFTEPRTWPENAKRKKPEPYPGTRFGAGTILRVASAINDCLRQLGRFGPYQMPVGLPDIEQVGIWLHHDGPTCIPIVIRQQPDGTATAYLPGAEGSPSHTVPYADLPALLADGKGRIGPGRQQKQILAGFLVNVLGIGGAADSATHDRIVMVRAAGFRNWGWDWMQDKHLRPDQLILPGADIEDDADLPETIGPDKTPGLRIVRIRDRSSTMEVPRGFANDLDKHHPRVSGLFRASERIYYSVNPKSDQMQTPHGRTKLDPDVLTNFSVQASNPVPLEICVAHQRPDDDPAALATLVSLLRRAHAHTDQATKYPGVLHLCSLADEYL